MTARRDNGHVDLTIWGISDLEMLGVIDDLADEDGWTRTVDIRLQLGESMDKGYRSGVGPRCAWLARYGWVERDVQTRKGGNERRWRLTAIGHTLLDNPRLTKALSNALASMNPAQRMIVTRELAEAANQGADEVRNALRRQWQRSLGGAR